jgi:hypothetical protein
MIRLHEDYLLFHTSEGDIIPCSAELVAVELVGNSILDSDLIRDAANAVLHYFKTDLGKTHVTVAEFSAALQRVLMGLGFNVTSSEPAGPAIPVAVADLRDLASANGDSFELGFFITLREELRRQLTASPAVVRFEGLHGCVKQILGAKRWNDRCQKLSDQIVDYLRECWSTDARAAKSGLIVQ